MYLNNRDGEACRNVGGGGGGGGGGGRIKGSFTDETGVHGCHCSNLTTAWLGQLRERRSAERVVC